MLRAVLFDLDDTLLGNSMDEFLPVYFDALTRYLEHQVPPERLIPHLMRGTEAMDAHEHVGLTNEEAFAAAFYPGVEADRSVLEPAFERFYADEFPKLRSFTCERPEARVLVERALDEGLQVVVATNPMFPRVAVEHRLSWAGVPVDEYDYALVTTYETMHATKSDVAYYREILSRIEREAGECLMVGDSWELDMVPASAVGMHVYWITDLDHPSQAGVGCGERGVSQLVGYGSLAGLLAAVRECGFFAQVCG